MPVEIIWCGILFPVLFILSSWISAKSGKLRNKVVRKSIILIGIVFLVGMVFAHPFVPQPRLADIYLRFAVGIPLAILGIAFRMYPLIYFKKMKTGPGFMCPSKWVLTLHGPAYFITSGPYSIVRQPQYVGGIIFIIGWFLIWGGLCSIYILPVLIIFILFWALIEEKYILEKEFGNEYKEYKKKVGMFFPKIGRK
jgi:protein-S-isoprenylcysteine O-methyltransferase Ste14